MTRARLLLLTGVLVVSVGLDQLTKTWADASLGTLEHPVVVRIEADEEGQTLAEVLRARFDWTDADLDELQQAPLGGVALIYPSAQARPGDKAFRKVQGETRVRFYWAFHHRTFSMPPRRIPLARTWRDSVAEIPDGTVEDLVAANMPYLDDEARRQVVESFLFAEVPGPIALERLVQKDETYLVTDRRVPIIDGLLQMKYAENPGAAWGMLADADEDFRKYFFLLVTLVAITAISWLYHRLTPAQTIAAWGFAIILSGAVGNFLDRLRFNYVIDFIDMYIGESHWPTYNVADIAIAVGVGLLLLELPVKKHEAFLSAKEKPKPPDDEDLEAAPGDRSTKPEQA